LLGEDARELPLEAWEHEPHVALFGGLGGHRIAERLVEDLPRLLRPGGYALLELGPRQANALVARAAALGLVEWKRNRDLAVFERVLVLSRPA
jgi:release factor glutamine methyltransferase